jgi:hypothetical protein
MTRGFDRRRLLRLSGFGLATLGLAPWIAEALAWEAGNQDGDPRGGEKPSLSPRALALSQAWAEASRRGRPLLVLVVPVIRDRNERGIVLATYLQGAPEAAHADLALCEVGCATVPELRALLPAMKGPFEGEPMGVLVEPDGKKARAVVGKIPKLPDSRSIRLGQPTAAEIDDQERWVDSIAAEFHAAIAGDRRALERRAHQALERLPRPEREQLVLLEARGERPSASHVGLCPAWALFGATTEDARVECAAELSRISRASLVEHAPRGARWAKYGGGCAGLRFEDPLQTASAPGPCGIGCVPEESRRFLWLYTKSDP